MIKKILLTLGIIGFGFISYTFGYAIDESGPRFGQGVIGSEVNNIHDTNVDFVINSNLSFSSSFNNENRDIFTFYSKSNYLLIFYRNNGLINFYNRNGYGDIGNGVFTELSYGIGGSMKYYLECDLIEGNFTRFNNCVLNEYSGNNIDTVNNALSLVKDGDIYIYGQHNAGVHVRSQSFAPFIGISISDYGKTLVFTYKVDGTPDSKTNSSYGISIFGRSVNILYTGDYLFDTFPSDLIGDSPFIGGDSFDTPISGGQSPISGGYSYMNCTNQNVLAYYIKTFGYNGSMCNIVSGGVAEGYYPYGTLKEFCNIIYIFNNEDLSYYNKPYTGHNKNIICDSPNAYLDYSGDNASSIDWSDEFSGVVNGSGEYEVQSSDSFLINLTNILKGNFYLPEAGDFGLGYLPRYIILGFMGVIFFNFIRK